jgi:hypothetical protein
MAIQPPRHRQGRIEGSRDCGGTICLPLQGRGLKIPPYTSDDGKQQERRRRRCEDIHPRDSGRGPPEHTKPGEIGEVNSWWPLLPDVAIQELMARHSTNRGRPQALVDAKRFRNGQHA